MADLLRMGHTMLNIACPICNNPIFQNKNGDKFCPSCDRKVVVVNDKTAQSYQNDNLNSKNNLSIKPIIKEVVYTSLEDVISKKIQWLTEKLHIETDIELIRSYTNLISNLLHLLKTINSTFKKIQE
jgi:uncharacterized Zn finger protein (UPF0148 family)